MISTIDQLEQIESTHRSVGEWVDIAVDNAEAAELLAKTARLRPLSLHMVQQSMEAATKALATAAGISHYTLKTHNNLDLFVRTLGTFIGNSAAAEYANSMLSPYAHNPESYDVIQHLQTMLSLTSSPSKKKQNKDAERLFESALTASPAEVKLMLKQLDQIEKRMRSIPERKTLRKRLRNNKLSLRLDPTDPSPEQSVIQQVVAQSLGDGNYKQQNEFTNAILANLGDLIVSKLQSQSGSDIGIDGAGILRGIEVWLFDAQTVNFGILIVGSLVWPHESYPRYAPTSDAPDSLQQAAKHCRQGKLGRRHYNDELGVIKHIKPLIRSAKKTTALLKKCYDAGCYSADLTMGR